MAGKERLNIHTTGHDSQREKDEPRLPGSPKNNNQQQTASHGNKTPLNDSPAAHPQYATVKGKQISLFRVTDDQNHNLLSNPSPQTNLTANASPSTPEDEPMQNTTSQRFEDEGGGKDAYEKAQLEPPVTPDSLAELETPRILSNPKLRHDVNFDRELHFRPNLDGQRGKQKTEANELYWEAVRFELQLVEEHRIHSINASGLNRGVDREKMVKCKKRLPNIFMAVRDIMISLVPEVDQEKVSDRLDVDFLMQQIDNGVLDLIDLAKWLHLVITTHCAPMRDEKAAEMKDTVINAVHTGDTGCLAEGLKQLVDIMECMKLDVANHQIRHIKTYLINETVSFQREYNGHRMKNGKIDGPKSFMWLQNEIEQQERSGWQMDILDCLCSALIENMLSLNDNNGFPSTFHLDHERLKVLAMEMHNYIYREICHGILIELLPIQPGLVFLPAWTALQTYLTAIVDAQGAFLKDKHANIAVQIAKIIMDVSDNQEITEHGLACVAEARLKDELDTDSITFGRQKVALSNRVLPKLQTSVQQHVRMTALELQDALVPHPTPSLSSMTTTSNYTGFGAVLEPARPVTPTDPDLNLVRRLTHIVVLHWQVWSELLYCRPADEVMEGVDEVMANSQPSATPPRKTPVFEKSAQMEGQQYAPEVVSAAETNKRHSQNPHDTPYRPPDQHASAEKKATTDATAGEQNEQHPNTRNSVAPD